MLSREMARSAATPLGDRQELPQPRSWQTALAGAVWSCVLSKSIATGRKGFIEHTLNIYMHILIKYNLSQWNNVGFIKGFC